MKKILLLLAVVTLTLSGCSFGGRPTTARTAIVKGPAPQVVHLAETDRLLACEASTLSQHEKKVTFTVGNIGDKSGRQNVNGSGDALGPVNTESGRNMAMAAVHATGVTVIDYSPEVQSILDQAYQHGQLGPPKVRTDGVDINTGKAVRLPSPVVYPPVGLPLPRYVIAGDIDGTDILPGDGADIGFAGFELSGNHNSVYTQISLRAVSLPDGELIAQSIVRQEIVNGGVQFSVSRPLKLGGLTSLFTLDLGHQYRQPLQVSTQDAFSVAVADLMDQLHTKKAGCVPADQKMVARAN